MKKKSTPHAFTEPKSTSPQLIYLVFYISLCCAAASWLWYLYQSPSLLPLRHIDIHAPFSHVTNYQLQEIMAPFLKRNWLSTDIQTLEQAIAASPWVAEVSIRRQWPDSLSIHLREREAWLRFGNDTLLDTEGHFFEPNDISDIINSTHPLPVLIGNIEKRAKLVDYYLTINRQLAPLQLNATQVVLTERDAVKITLNNHVLIELGQHEPLQALKRFVTIYPRLTQHGTKMAEKFDLRYPDGMAVEWKQ